MRLTSILFVQYQRKIRYDIYRRFDILIYRNFESSDTISDTSAVDETPIIEKALPYVQLGSVLIPFAACS